jgi:hypothetical protein
LSLVMIIIIIIIQTFIYFHILHTDVRMTIKYKIKTVLTTSIDCYLQNKIK